MLRHRLLFALSSLVILLVGVGVAGLLLLRSATLQFEERQRVGYGKIETVVQWRMNTLAINSNYLRPLMNPYNEEDASVDRAFFDQYISRVDQRWESMGEPDPSTRKGQLLLEVDSLRKQYADLYQVLFDREPREMSGRTALYHDTLDVSRRITEVSEELIKIYKEELFQSTDNLTAQSMASVFAMLLLMGVGVIIALLVYFHLARAIVDPVVSLAQSIEAVKQGNFECTLPMPKANNELSRLIPAFNDMAGELRQRRREAEALFQRTTRQSRAILVAIPAPVFVLAGDGIIEQMNPAAEDLLSSLRIDMNLPAPLQRRFEECRLRNQDYLPDDIREAVLVRINDEENYYLPRIFRFGTDGDSENWWAVILMDVSRFRWLDELKTNLISTVSHEIKTPLTGIRMVLHLLLEARSGPLTSMQQDMLESARDDCERLLSTLRRLLDLARVESGAAELSLKPVALDEAAERSIRLYKTAAEERQMDLCLDADEKLPKVQADSVRIDEVIHNLVSNALKHGPKGEQVLLRLRPVSKGRFVRMSVIDKGPGVPAEARDRVFEKFYRAPGEAGEGVGLGLSIAREIVIAHNGKIGLADRDDETEFFFDLPVAHA